MNNENQNEIAKTAEVRTAGADGLRRSFVAAVVLAATALILGAALIIVNFVHSLSYTFTDTYYDAEKGAMETETYRVKKTRDGYVIFDRQGNRMPVNDSGYYVLHSENQYELNAETGDCRQYAVVDYDTLDGEALGYANRVLMYPEVPFKTTYSIHVDNLAGNYSYEIYRDSAGELRVKDFEDSQATFDASLFTTLWGNCGYPLATMKLNFSSPETPRTPTGDVDYSAYGLDSPQAVFTIKGALIEKDANGNVTSCLPDPNLEYTVDVGDAVLSGTSYYARVHGRNSVFIIDAAAVLQSLEYIMDPTIITPLTAANYVTVTDFRFSVTDTTVGLDNLVSKKDIVAFSFTELSYRKGTIYASTPYLSNLELMKGYLVNDDSISDVLTLFYEMKVERCLHIGIDDESLDKYGLLGENIYFLEFWAPVQDEEGNIGYVCNQLLINPEKTENGTYYVASLLYDMIAEVDQHYLSFVEWQPSRWYDKYFFDSYIAYTRYLSLEFNGDEYQFAFSNLSERTADNPANANNLLISGDRYVSTNPSYPNLLNADTVFHTFVNQKGMTETETMTSAENFRKLFMSLSFFTIEGDFDPDAFLRNKGMTVEEYIAKGDDVCDAIFTIYEEDYATDYTYHNEKGELIDLYPVNNCRYNKIRFYNYTEGRTLVTVESLPLTAEGESDPTNVVTAFYVSSAYLEKVRRDLQKLMNREYIDYMEKY